MTFDDLGDSPRTFFFKDPPSGLHAILCVDDLTLGPAAGGIRTCEYASIDDALGDARSLARAMSDKCALAGLRAGGAKTVVFADAIIDRSAAFEVLGRRIEELRGLYRCAGDLGTTDADLTAVSRSTGYVHTNSPDLAASVARSTLRCIEAIVEFAGREVSGLRVALQGCGSIGSAVARLLAEQGAQLLVADLNVAVAQECAAATGGEVLAAEAILYADVDLLVPCATGGVITDHVIDQTTAFGVCGAANNVLATAAVAESMASRGVLHAPDVLASAGAVIDGIGQTVMGLDRRGREELIDALKGTTQNLLARAKDEGIPPEFLAHQVARERIRAGESL